MPYSKWYMKSEDANDKAFVIYSHLSLDITVECILDNSDHFNPTMMDIEFFSSEKKQEEILYLEKVSSWEWKHNGAIAL